MSLKRITFCLVVAAGLAACGPENNGSDPNNTTSNNTTSNNTTSNNTTSNNTTSNNTTSNNTTSNNTTSNNTSGTNNQTVTPAMCVEPRVACLSNDDCPSDQRCEGDPNSPDLSGCCAVGERGTKMVGEECANEYECASGLCVGRNDSPEICSQPCDMDTPCPDDLECNAVLALCVTPDP